MYGLDKWNPVETFHKTVIMCGYRTVWSSGYIMGVYNFVKYDARFVAGYYWLLSRQSLTLGDVLP